MFAYLLISGLYIFMVLRICQSYKHSLQGKLLVKIRLNLPERLLLRRRNLFVLSSIILLSVIGQWFAPLTILALLIIGLAINALPASYSLTTQGLTCDTFSFRRWEEFSSFQIKGTHLTLLSQQGRALLKLIVNCSHQKEMLPVVTQFCTKHSLSVPPKRRLLWRIRKYISYPVMRPLLYSFLLLALTGILLSACNDPGKDPSGLNTASQQNLQDVTANSDTAPISQEDLITAREQEPFAYHLALLVDANRLGINYVWTLFAGYLVMFMQLGFALLETGFGRAKHATHTILMNFMIYAISMLGYFAAGFALQFGGVGLVGIPNLGGLDSLNHKLSIHIGGVDWGIIGYKGFFFTDGAYDAGIAVVFLFQMVFMATAATIPTGAMTERLKWSAFCVYGLFISIVVYPVFGNWAWGGGWLAQLGSIGLGVGYVDFAGSGVVHAVGGWCALAGAMVLGPRIGKYQRDGTVNTIPGHNMTLAVIGAFILAFGWLGFNPGSTMGVVGNGNLRIGIVAVVTMLAGSSGAVSAMIITWITGSKKPQPGMMINGLLAGFVAITGSCGYVSPLSACIIGAIAGLLMVVFTWVIEHVWKIDDPVGAIVVHGINGVWGQIAVGLFADGLANYGGLQVRGLFYGDAGQLGAQLIGVIACFAYVFTISWIFFQLYNRIFGLRVSAQTELAGLDVPELGTLAYPQDDDDASFPPVVAIEEQEELTETFSEQQRFLPYGRPASPDQAWTGPPYPSSSDSTRQQRTPSSPGRDFSIRKGSMPQTHHTTNLDPGIPKRKPIIRTQLIKDDHTDNQSNHGPHRQY